MVNEYIYDRCRYLAGSLKPFVYVLPKETTNIDYEVGFTQIKPVIISKVEVNNIYATNIIKIEGFKTMLNVTETVDNRLQFATKVTLSLRENWGEAWVSLLNQLKRMQCYVVVEDYNGVQYIQTPEFTSAFGYNYNFDTASNNGHIAEVTFSCDANNPVVILKNNIVPTQIIGNDCAYQDGKVIDFRMTPYQYAFIDNDAETGQFTTITCTGGESMHRIEFTPKSFQFRQQYDGRNYQERLTFQIPLSDYKYYFRYDLVAFMQNRYAIVFRTSQDNWIAAGFEFGMMPTYTVETSETVEELNFVEITLQHTGQNSIFYCSDRTPEIIDSETMVFVPVTSTIKDPITGLELNNWFCLNKTEAIYTLVELVTESGVPTDTYWCLDGYQTYYQHLNIVGSYTRETPFDFELVFSNSACATTDNCKFIKMTKEVYSFSKAGDYYDVHIQNPCPWTLEDIPNWISASITSGDGGTDYVVRFTSREDATEQRKISISYLRSVDNVSTIQFILEIKVDWIQPVEHFITAKAQTVSSYINLDYNSYEICDVPDGLVAEKIRGNSTVRIKVPENTDETSNKNYTVTICNTQTGERGYIYIHQDNIYTRWVEDVGRYVCVAGTSYRRIVKYKGYTEDNINIMTSEFTAGAKLLDNDPNCHFDGGDGEYYGYQWRDVDGTICIEEDGHHNLYSKQRKWETHNGGTSWEATNEYQKNTLIEQDSSQCEDLPDKSYKFIIDESMSDCLGTNSFFIQCKWWTYDNIEYYKVDPSECERSQSIKKENDPACGGGGIVPGYNEKYVDSAETYCKDGFLFYLLRKYTSNDGGITWTATDEYKEGNQSSGISCVDEEKGYSWIIDYGTYICDGYTSYYAEKYYYHYLSKPNVHILVEPVQMRKGETVKSLNDPLCGYEDPNKYRWNTNTGHTVCQGLDKYTREDYEYSTDDGLTWLPTGEYRAGVLVEANSQDCSGQKYYRWEIDNTRWVCVGTTSYYLEVRYESTDNDIFIKSVPEVTQTSSTRRIEDDPECGGGGTIYRWVDDGDNYLCEYPDENPMIQTRWVAMPKSEWVCREYNLYKTEKEQMTEDGGQNWYDTGEIRQTTLGDDYSNECAVKNDRSYNNGAVYITWDSSGDRTTQAQGIYLDYRYRFEVDSSVPAAFNTRLRVVTDSPQGNSWYRVVSTDHTVEGVDYRSYMIDIPDNRDEGTISFYWEVYDLETDRVLHTTRSWTITRNSLT